MIFKVAEVAFHALLVVIAEKQELCSIIVASSAILGIFQKLARHFPDSALLELLRMKLVRSMCICALVLPKFC